MNAPSDVLSEARYARIFQETIVPRSGILSAASHDKPKAIILAGQPGAGKGGLAARTEAELFDDAVTVDPDRLRDYDPKVKQLRELHPYTWSGDTHPFASRAANDLRELAVQQNKNVIIDTTLDHPSKP